MTIRKLKPELQSLVKSLILALTWILIGTIWIDMDLVFRTMAIVAGLAFAIEGIVKYNKQKTSTHTDE